MSLAEQKNKFLQSTKGKKAIAFSYKWFNDFSGFKIEPTFLQSFYSLENFSDSIPVSAEKDFSDYEHLFWFWFYKRYDRLQTEVQIGIDNAAYEKEIAEIEASNPLNFLSNLFNESKSLLLLIGGGFLFYKFLGRKK